MQAELSCASIVAIALCSAALGCGSNVVEPSGGDGGGGRGNLAGGAAAAGAATGEGGEAVGPATCDYDCLGGECIDGQCQPVVIAKGFKPSALAVDADHLFVVAVTGEVYGGAKDAVDLPLFAVGDDEGYGIAVDGERVVWTGHDSLWQADETSGATLETGAETYKAYDVALDGAIFYSRYEAFGAVSESMGRGAPGVVLAQEGLPHGFSYQRGIKDYSRLYYFSEDGLVVLYLTEPPSRTVVVPAGVAGMAAPIGLARNHPYGDAFWTNGLSSDLGGGLYRASDEGSPELVAPLEVPIMVAVDGDAAFVTTYEALDDAFDGNIVFVDLSTGESQILASGRHDPYQIVVDSEAIYWIEPDEDHAVMRLARPDAGR